MTSGGARPIHLGRRGAVYYVRFRLPVDLAHPLGVAEIQKSLQTKELGAARQLCVAASLWFEETVAKLRCMTKPTRTDLEAAARAFFNELTKSVDQPRSFERSDVENPVAWNIDVSEDRVSELDRQLVSNRFDDGVQRLANDMLSAINQTLPGLDQADALLAQKLAARAARQQMRYFVHQLTSPITAFEPDDDLFKATFSSSEVLSPFPVAGSSTAFSGKTLGPSVEEYLGKKQAKGLSQSQVDEVTRAMGWLQEVVLPARMLGTITKDEMRGFRDDLERLDRTLRGKAAPFRHRLTNVRDNQIVSATSTRYWKSVQAFFSWCVNEGKLTVSPADGLRIEPRKGEVKRTPEAFSVEEIKRLFETPLFAGHLSLRKPTKPGSCRIRSGRWWAGVLPLFTGLRAGELSQLLPSDFVFDAPIPHLKVQEVDGGGARVKSTKNAASIRDVPLAPILLELGLRQFVEAGAKKYPKDRVFREFRLGTRGRISDGMTKFWSSYLKEFDLWKPGRATHVARHTVVGRLRALEVSVEDIGAFVGHTGGTQTDKYGGTQHPLERKVKTAKALNYGFDVVGALGGPYDPKVHGG